MVAGHLHHGQRSEADTEMSLCEAFCETLDVPFLSGKADVPQMSADLKIGLEEAGRRARYTFFEQAAARLGCQLIATAHTQDDHVETVLLNLTRGSGMTGLRGIPAQRDQIVRPILEFTRAQTQAYCEQHALWTHEDPANYDLNFARARVRHRVLPELAQINPEVRRSIARMTEIVAEEDQFLDQAAMGWFEHLLFPLNGPLEFLTAREEVAVRRDAFAAGPPVLARRALRGALQFLGASPEQASILRISEGVQGSGPGSETLPGGEVVAEWGQDILHLRRLQEIEPFRHGITLPGETIADVFGWQITAFPVEGADFQPDRTNLTASLDAAKVKGQLHFRSQNEGEKFSPLGMSESKLVSAMLQEHRLTALAKRRLPVVCDLVGPVWIPGIAVAERVKLESTTLRYLSLKFGPILDEHAHNG